MDRLASRMIADPSTWRASMRFDDIFAGCLSAGIDRGMQGAKILEAEKLTSGGANSECGAVPDCCLNSILEEPKRDQMGNRLLDAK